MIDAWWRKEFGREPTIDELCEMQRAMALAPVQKALRRIERIFDGVLIVWAVVAIAGLLSAMMSGLPEERHFIYLAWFFLLPILANNWRSGALRRTTWRAMKRQVREDRLDEINTIIASH
jgi:hypothetical protein